MATATNENAISYPGDDRRIRREHQRTRDGKTITVREHALPPAVSRPLYPKSLVCRLTARQHAWLLEQATAAPVAEDRGMAAQVRRLVDQARGRVLKKAVTITETFEVKPGEPVTVEPGKTVLIETGTPDADEATE